MEIIVCPLCKSPLYTTLYMRTDISYALCTECGLVYLNPRMTADEARAFYATTYQKERHNITDVERAIARMQEPGRYERKRVRAQEFVPLVTRDSRVLEIGVGYGTLLAAVRELTGAQVFGLEPSDMGVEVAKRIYDLDIFHGDFDAYAASAEGEMFDLIIMSHVLEHLGDPAAALTRIRSLLAPRGILHIAVPDVLLPDDAPDRFFHIEHLIYFSPRTLVRMLTDAGFVVTYLEERDRELVVRAELQGASGKTPIAWGACQGTPDDVRAAHQKHGRKYAFLRFFRLTVQKILPRSLAYKLRKQIARVLRAGGVIKQ